MNVRVVLLPTFFGEIYFMGECFDVRSRTFAIYLDDKGNIFGKMGRKFADELQSDNGVCIFNDDGSF